MNNNRIYRQPTVMHQQRTFRRWVIWLTLIIAFMLQLLPWWPEYAYCKPNWVLLFLIYWVIALSYGVGIGTAFVIGLVLDLLLGSILGVRALVFSLLIYLTLFRVYLLKSLAVWQQSFFIILISILYEIFMFIIEFLLNNHITFNPIILTSALVNGLLWPFVYLLLSFIQKKLYIH